MVNSFGQFNFSFTFFSKFRSSSFYKNEEPIIFPLSSDFVDFHNGSMESLSSWLRLHPVTLVVYYASWSGQSLKAIPEIMKTHDRVKNNPLVSNNNWTALIFLQGIVY